MRLLVVFFLILTLLHSTTISGDIYNADSMEKLNNTIITFENNDNVIMQQLCHSPYSIDVESGNYTIRAYYFDNGSLKYYSENHIQTNQDNMKLDLVLMPYELLLLSPGFSPPPAINPSNTINTYDKENTTDYTLYVVLAFVFLISISIYWIFLHNKKNDVDLKKECPEIDEDCKKVLKILNENEGRMVQKELREILNFSETKMSLIITELEVSGHIKKIKKGRGNILKVVK